jgi:hypothetical protein
MNIIALVLLIIAAVVFLLGGTYRNNAPGWYSSTNLGLVFLTVGLIIQFAAKSHSIVF